MKPVFVLAVIVAVSSALPRVNKTRDAKIWVHLMPWFETRETSDDGEWGMHWTMANKNPDIIDSTGRREIAAHYYPEDDLYGSGDPGVIERQLNQMKYAGIDGVIIDWPGTLPVWDYPKNLKNSEAIIDALERMGMEWAICYEDHNIGMAADAGFITDKPQAGKNDMLYMQQNYFNRPNYIKMNGAPFLIDFGPQTFLQPGDWDDVLSVLNPRPHFYTLWHQMWQGGENARGEYAWLWVDFLLGLGNFYDFNPSPEKMGVAYPGFHTFYDLGGWPGPGWRIDHNGTESFRQTLQLALDKGMTAIQIATWNDYGEGTMIEPTREFGTGFLEVLQKTLVPQYTTKEFDIIRELYKKRIEFKGRGDIQKVLDQVAGALANMEPKKAAQILATV